MAEYSTLTPQTTPVTRYLTSDHLGSPRIITGSNGAVLSRRDFMPYGEEAFIGTGPRAVGHGYTYGDSTRQKFTGYERDEETNLDFAQARMFSYGHGRFTGVDPLLSTGEPNYPQTWNRYAYSLNSPLYYTDPSGMYVCKGNKTQCEQFANRLAEAKTNLTKIEEKYGKDSKQYKRAEAATNSYGENETGKKTNNGVFVTFNKNDGEGATTRGTFADKGKGKLKIITVSFDEKALDSDSSQSLVAHEGDHVDYFQTKGNNTSEKYSFEFRGHYVDSLFSEAQYSDSSVYFTAKDGSKYDIWNSSWEGPDKETLRSKAINEWLAVPTKNGGNGLKPPSPPKTRPNNPQTKKKV